ncbi:MAG: NUDIX hydrolase N-terminal domain-containing protein [Anaerolineae bacterium]|nr:NUDIX hydrolase N-terminal domain-containing protein [Anaerolineae bacterium]
MKQNNLKEITKLLEIIFAQAKNGIAFAKHPYDLVRYQEIIKALSQISQIHKEANKSNPLDYLEQIDFNVGNQEYVTPKVAVATATFNTKGEILLVQIKDDLWSLPGGYADIGLDPASNAEKEVREETNLEVKVKSLIGVYDSNISEFPSTGRQIYTLAFFAELLGGEIKADLVEVKAALFFAPEHLPQVPRSTKLQIERAVRIFRGENLSSYIDQL